MKVGSINVVFYYWLSIEKRLLYDYLKFVPICARNKSEKPKSAYRVFYTYYQK